MKNIIDNTDLIERLEDLRCSRGIKNRAQLAVLAGLPRVNMYYIYNHQRKLTLEVANKLCKALDCSLEELIGCTVSEYNFGRVHINNHKKGSLDVAVRTLRQKTLQPREAIKKNVTLKPTDTFRQTNFVPVEVKKTLVKINKQEYMMIDGRNFLIPTEHPPMPKQRPGETFDEYYERLRSGI